MEISMLIVDDDRLVTEKVEKTVDFNVLESVMSSRPVISARQ